MLFISPGWWLLQTDSIISVGVKLEGKNQFLTPAEKIETV